MKTNSKGLNFSISYTAWKANSPESSHRVLRQVPRSSRRHWDRLLQVGGGAQPHTWSDTHQRDGTKPPWMKSPPHAEKWEKKTSKNDEQQLILALILHCSDEIEKSKTLPKSSHAEAGKKGQVNPKRPQVVDLIPNFALPRRNRSNKIPQIASLNENSPSWRKKREKFTKNDHKQSILALISHYPNEIDTSKGHKRSPCTKKSSSCCQKRP